MKTEYVCQQCGSKFPKWSGQCLSCGAWNSLVEEVTEVKNRLKSGHIAKSAVKKLGDLLIGPGQEDLRFSTTIKELDRVLGGGVVRGEVVLLTGSPGIGKSTLLTQMALGVVNNRSAKARVVYLAGEENPKQIGLRIKRILDSEHLDDNRKKQSSFNKQLNQIELVEDTRVERVIDYLKQVKPQLVIVDSIQTLTSEMLSGVAGSVGQVRASAEQLIEFAKKHNTTVFLVGHITKEGRVAGPMTLEHMVDAVLDFSGDKSVGLRLLRATKNRFGATDEVGVFQLADSGFYSVANPSELFTSHQDLQTAVGAVFSCVIEGTRPLLVEVQALVVPSFLPSPRRVGRGIDVSRLQVLTAVLERYVGLPLGKHDVFVSIVGGYRTKEPALDLAVAAAIISSMKNKPMGQQVFVGEVGLLGEIRRVKLFDQRQKEIKRLGYSKLISYKNIKHIRDLLH